MVTTDKPARNVPPSDREPTAVQEAAMRAGLAAHPLTPPSPLPEGRADGAWRCDRCGSDQWVGYRSSPYAKRFAQCVPCGHVQPTPAAPVAAVPEAGEVVHALMMQGGERLPLCGEPQPVHRWAGLSSNPNEVTCRACLGVPEAGEREAEMIEQCVMEKGPHDAHDYHARRHGWAKLIHCPGLPAVPVGVPADLTDAEKAELVAALDDLHGPVGVQPEPAEGCSRCVHALSLHLPGGCDVWRCPCPSPDLPRGGAAGEECNAVQGRRDGGLPGNAEPMPSTTTATPAAERPPLGAVPVVHPEPAEDGPALDWLLTWVMAQDYQAMEHYWHMVDGKTKCCHYEETP